MDFGWCAANPDLVAENEVSNCAQFVPHQQEIADMLGVKPVPTGMWPSLDDPRIDAVVALAPDGDIWGAEYSGVAALQVPTLIVVGSKDTVLIPEHAAYPIYEHLGSAKKSLVVFENADHFIFFSQCRDIPWMSEIPYFVCSDAVWDMDRAHDLINHFVTAFLLAELKGDAEAAKALAPENVTFPGIRYETTAFTATAQIAVAD
jgi:predicted dienelactone hydrolase